MWWIKFEIENPSKSEFIGRCGGDEKTNDHPEPTKVERLKNPTNVIWGILALVNNWPNLQ